MTEEVKKQVLQFIREKTKNIKDVPVGDANGNFLKKITLPMWRSEADYCKVVYPEAFFNVKDLKGVANALKAFITENNLKLKFTLFANYTIEVANCKGWKFVIEDDD